VRLTDDSAREPGSLRLYFVYDDEGLRLRKHAPRAKAARPGAALDRERPPNAVVVELRAAEGAVLYRQVLPHAIPQSAEITDDDGLHQVSTVSPSGGFSVVVPRPAADTEVVVLVGPEIEVAQPGLAPRHGEPRRWRELTRARLEGGSHGG